MTYPTRLHTLAVLLTAGMFMWLPVNAQAAGEIVLTKAGVVTSPAALLPARVPSVTDVASANEPEEIYKYLARGGRDPFVAPAQARASKKKDTKDLPILQQIGLERFRVIGTVAVGRKYKAMVSTEDGKGYTLQVGTHIGVNKGRVRRITSDSIIVEEYKTDVFGERKRYETVLALRPGEVLP